MNRILLCLPLAAAPLSALGAEEKKTQDTQPITSLDTLVITGNRSGQTVFEQIQTTSVLAGDEYLLRLEPTLGQMLRSEPGVSSTYFAPAASRPIIRGLGDDRIRILQNGASLIDVSNVSADHALAVDPLTISKVEIIRGPASLLYGPNTVGGVVNVIDNRITDKKYEGTYPSVKYDFSVGSADDSVSNSASITWGSGPLVVTLDGFQRNTQDIQIPGFARSAQELLTNPGGGHGEVPNSFSDTKGLGLGVSHIFENGFVGFSYSGINSEYGTVGEEDVTIGLKQRRWEARGATYNPTDWLKEINFKFGYSDYTHTEFEGAEVGTVFEIEGFNLRIEALNTEIAGFEGTFGYEGQSTDFSVLGDEAFLPPSETTNHSLFFLQEKDFGKFSFQFGARYDHQESESKTTTSFGAGTDHDFDAFSASVGIIYNPTEDYALSGTLAYTQRPPTAVELFANGPHVATSTFEVGDVNLGTENAFSLDLSARKRAGRVTGSFNAFYYRFNDYISLNDTGAIDPVDSLPIFAFQDVNADFYGAELEATFHLFSEVEADPADREGYIQSDSRLDLTLRADYVQAENRDTGAAIPRIPPFRAGFTLEYGNGPFTAAIDGQYSAEQTDTAAFETSTDSFFLLGASLSYKTTIANVDSTFYIRGVNLTDEEARLSTSFLKDVSPLAGRGVIAGLRAEF